MPGALFAQSPVPPVAAPLSAWTEIEAEAAKAPPTGYNAYKAALASRPMWKNYFATYANWTAPAPRVPADGRLPNLSEKPRQPRFPLTPRVWPAKPGEASVCLWEDDKVAAVSFGIDDNNAMEVPMWLEISRTYGGIPITWNLITSNIDGVIDRGRVGSAGTWTLWKSVLDQGYQIQSHSVSHVGNPVLEDGWPGPDWEAAESMRQLDTNLPGQHTKVFVPPGASIKFFAVSGAWRASVVKYYASARGSSGIPINPANQTDYFDIRTTANIGPFVADEVTPGTPAWIANNQLKSILDPAHKNYRGWATFFTHALNFKDAALLTTKDPALAKVFDFYNKNRDQLWVGQFANVALYGQQRDTATIKILRTDASGIALDLTSRMDPEVFDYPLTVKVRLPDAWAAVAASQAGSPVPCSVVRNDGATYALVKARPDRGEILVAPKKN
ncbi:hypothetical protein FPL22_03785 [Rariglobus hedericola]|uniref:NodB homology domain-containing protein n=1 Tax=Rariglobus hedericola TaxID=2597822 RepID=A0A556QP54_9BACT|nr:hypothetical protein FPL22_03785 [Rariglobus hedericola]